MNRREFLKMGAGAAMGAAFAETAMATAADVAKAGPGPHAPLGDIRAMLIHLGSTTGSGDWYPEDIDVSKIPGAVHDEELLCRDDTWRRVTDHAAEKKLNMIVIDVCGGVVYPRRPELAVKGSWPAEKLAAEVDRLHGLGLEVVPLVNFSTSHDSWLKQYRRMVGTTEYYRVCEDVIRDVHEIFGAPRFVHIGCDEEDGYHHVMVSKSRQFIVVRRGEVWKHDFLHLVRTVETLGARPWIWSDHGWDFPDFHQWCPKSVVMSNWYYDECYGGFDPATNKTQDLRRLKQYWQLEEAGFDQIPCGTNWVGWKRAQEKVGADDVIGKLVKTCRGCISKEHLLGFLMTSWSATSSSRSAEGIMKAIDLLAAAVASKA